MSWVLVGIGALVNAVVIGFVARRLLDAPVGWPRTLALSVGVNFAISPLLDVVLRGLHLAPVVGHQAQGPAEFAVIGLVISWLLVLQVAALAVLETLIPTGSIGNPINGVTAMVAGARRGTRYAQILRIMARHGLSAYLRRRAVVEGDAPALAVSVREAFTEAGVTFVKLGQMLSTRADLLPAAYLRELAQLQSTVPAEPWALVEPVLRAELGSLVDTEFEFIDPVPIAAASVAQIHAARLRDGAEVVIKIQRPNAYAQVTVDLDIVERLASALDRQAQWARDLGVTSLARGFAVALDEELDYRIELANMRAVAAAAPELTVPSPYPALSGRRVLTMARLAGEPLSAVLARRPAGQAALSDSARRAMAETLLVAVMRQVVVTGVFHADLHPGNIFLQPDGALALLDFGSVGRLDQGDRMRLATFLLAFDRQDAIAATTALVDLLAAPLDLDFRSLERDLGQLIMRYSAGLGDGGSAEMFTALFALVLRHRLAVPAPIAAALRALGAVEGSLAQLSGGLDLMATARAQARGILTERLSPREVWADARLQLAAMLPVLQRLPRRIDRITDQLASGELRINVRAFADGADRGYLAGLVHQGIVAGLAAALGIAGALLLIAPGGPELAGDLTLYMYLGASLLLFAFVLGARVLVRALPRGAGRDSRGGPG